MKIMYTFIGILFTLFTTASYAQTSELVKQLMKETDVTESQAKGGSGALFEMAKEEMSAEDFGKISDVVPEMDDLLGSVPAIGNKNSSMLGGIAKQITGMPKVVAAFDKLGISEDKVALFTPLIVNYVEKKGGKALGDLLGKTLN